MAISSGLHRLVTVLALICVFAVAASFGGLQASAAPGGRAPGITSRFQQGPPAYPASVTVQDQQFLFDRLVPLDRSGFERIEDQGRLAFYARAASGPFDVIYGLRAGASRF